MFTLSTIKIQILTAVENNYKRSGVRQPYRAPAVLQESNRLTHWLIITLFLLLNIFIACIYCWTWCSCSLVLNTLQKKVKTEQRCRLEAKVLRRYFKSTTETYGTTKNKLAEVSILLEIFSPVLQHRNSSTFQKLPTAMVAATFQNSGFLTFTSTFGKSDCWTKMVDRKRSL